MGVRLPNARACENQAIARTVAAIERATGQRPLGWHTRSATSPNTRRLLVEEGGFLYDSDAYNDDLPYYVNVAGKRHVVLKYTEYLEAGQEDGGMTDPEELAPEYRLATGRSVDVRPVQEGDHPETDVLLAANDVVFVPRSKIANVDNFVEMYIREVLPVSYIPLPTF